MSLQPPRDKRVSLADAVALVSDGAIVALGGGLSARLPMAMVRELVRQGRRGLHLVGSAHSIDVDMLVAVGAVRRCEESYVGFEQDLGLAPAYRRAAAVPAGPRGTRIGHRDAPSRVRDHYLPVHRGDPDCGARPAPGRRPAARTIG